MTYFLTIFVPIVIIPMFAFAVNWAWRGRHEYAQTAAADFIMGMLIFDAVVVSGSETFKPFVRDPAFQNAVIVYHV